LAAFLESLPLGGIGKLGAQSVPPGSSWRRRRARRDGRKRASGGVGCREWERAVGGGEVVVVAVADGRDIRVELLASHRERSRTAAS
jgi:hypothetical protein